LLIELDICLLKVGLVATRFFWLFLAMLLCCPAHQVRAALNNKKKNVRLDPKLKKVE
jgi:hypothetical protein